MELFHADKIRMGPVLRNSFFGVSQIRLRGRIARDEGYWLGPIISGERSKKQTVALLKQFL
jgi:hypothetical protein